MHDEICEIDNSSTCNHQSTLLSSESKQSTLQDSNISIHDEQAHTLCESVLEGAINDIYMDSATSCSSELQNAVERLSSDEVISILSPSISLNCTPNPVAVSTPRRAVSTPRRSIVSGKFVIKFCSNQETKFYVIGLAYK